MRLGNIATLSREWAAVKRAERSPLRDILLSGAARTLPPTQHLQVPRGLLDHLDTNYNASQYKALTAGLDGRPLVLIQGPPGTGKTQYVATTSGMACRLMHFPFRVVLGCSRAPVGCVLLYNLHVPVASKWFEVLIQHLACSEQSHSCSPCVHPTHALLTLKSR